MIVLKCPSCGATVKLREEQPNAFCSFCGSHIEEFDSIVKEIRASEEREKDRQQERYVEKHKTTRGVFDTISEIFSNLPLILLCLFVIGMMVLLFTLVQKIL